MQVTGHPLLWTPAGVRRGIIVAVAIGVVGSPINSRAAGLSQNPDQDASRSLLDGSREVIRTASTRADRFETPHAIVYIDKGLLTAGAEQEFAGNIERIFVA